ncbi:MAG: MmgE/PrpD family protein [Betaproteobacteria bacterium]|nr:MmgE/PrpD family protein [Betaproteobacteria bacterium]
MTQPLTAAYGAFIAQLKYKALPAEVVRTIKQGFTDCIGVMLAGSREPVTAAVERVLGADQATGSSNLYFTAKRMSAPAAALINGTASHALDYDDVALKGCHPSAVLVPAILAEAQMLNRSGRDMLVAYAAGYEVWADLIARERGNYQRKGWHPTGIFGAIGAAAACASLHRLNAQKAAHALGAAASEASGVMSNLGSMVKPTHPGKAAASGIYAARFAAAGIEATPDALEHAQGFLAALSPRGDIDLETPANLGQKQWQLAQQGLSIKQYPVCYRAHRAIDAMLGLLRKHPVEAADIAEIRVSFSNSHLVILKNHAPTTAIAAKFSIEFALACSLLAHRVGLRDLTDKFVRSTAVHKLMQRVVIDIDPTEQAGTSGYAPYDWVQIKRADGTVLNSEHVRHARGDAQTPLSDDELWAKFEDCVAWSRLKLDAKQLFTQLQQMEKLKSANDLFKRRARAR